MIKPGDVFKSKDKREIGRHVKVISADSRHAYCVACAWNGCELGSRLTRILLSNLEQRWVKAGADGGEG